MKQILCGCGHGTPTHPFEGLDGLRVHVVGEGSCCRKIATGDLIPTNFRLELWKHQNGKSGIVEVCTVNGYTITEWTLKNQRGYDNAHGVWTLPKSEDSINSIGDNW